MNVLALDLGTQTGFAVGRLNFQPSTVTSGSVSFKPKKFVSFGRRFKDFEAWLDRIHTLDPVDEVVFEEVRRHRGTDAAHIYGGFLATLTNWCDENALPFKGEPVGTIKKHATGNGGAGKPMMIAAAIKWGFKPTDDNEADALALLRMRLEQVGSVQRQYMGIFE